MARASMSLPHERRKATLKSAELKLRVRAAETKEQLKRVKDELKAMTPKKANPTGDLSLRSVKVR